MRSTITRYPEGSPMRVPPSLANSAATPSFFPSSLTRTMKAGGKLYSRPQRRPTFFMISLLTGETGPGASEMALVDGVCGGSPRLGDAARFRDQMFYDRLQVAGLLIDAQLALCAGAVFENGVDVFDGAAAAEIVHNVIDKI